MMLDLDYQTLKNDLLEDDFFNTILTDEEIEELIEDLRKGMI